MATVVELGPKTVGDDWSVYARRKAGNTVDPSDWTDLRAQLRTASGVLLASSDADDVTEGDEDTDPVLELSFDGDVGKGIPATDLEADPPVFCVHVVGDTSWFPTGNPVYLQVTAVAESLLGRQTVGTFSWLAEAQIEVNEEAP
jgi:hypothetical protein